MAKVASIAFSLLIVALLQVAQTQKLGIGGCLRNVKPLLEFSPASFSHDWYEYAKYPIISSWDKCNYYSYTFINENEMDLHYTLSTIKGSIPITLDAKVAIVNQSGMLADFGIFSRIFGALNYSILGTDNENWAVIYMCYNVGPLQFAATGLWILTGTSDPDPKHLRLAYDTITSNGLSLKELVESNQVDCPTRQNS